MGECEAAGYGVTLIEPHCMTRMEVYCGGTTEQVQNKFIVVVSTKRMKPTALENTIDHMIGSVSLGFTFGESRRYVD